MAAMLKSVAFPLSPFVGIPPRARDDTYSYAFGLSLLRSSYSDRSRAFLPVSRVLAMVRLTVARSSTFLSSFKESPENHHPHLRQGILGLPFASPPFLSSSFSFCHQAFLRIDMMARGSERGASTSPLEANRECGIRCHGEFPSGRSASCHYPP